MLCGRSSRNALALRTVAHTVQVRRVPARRRLWASRTVGRAPQTLACCFVPRDAPPKQSVCKTPEDRFFTRTLCRCGHTRALHSLQLMTPGERATHNPAPGCLHGIVPIDASDLGPCQKGEEKNTKCQYARAQTWRIGCNHTHHL